MRQSCLDPSQGHLDGKIPQKAARSTRELYQMVLSMLIRPLHGLQTRSATASSQILSWLIRYRQAAHADFHWSLLSAQEWSSSLPNQMYGEPYLSPELSLRSAVGRSYSHLAWIPPKSYTLAYWAIQKTRLRDNFPKPTDRCIWWLALRSCSRGTRS